MSGPPNIKLGNSYWKIAVFCLLFVCSLFVSDPCVLGNKEERTISYDMILSFQVVVFPLSGSKKHESPAYTQFGDSFLISNVI